MGLGLSLATNMGHFIKSDNLQDRAPLMIKDLMLKALIFQCYLLAIIIVYYHILTICDFVIFHIDAFQCVTFHYPPLKYSVKVF